MILECFQCFVTVLGRCAAILFSLPITDDVSLGSFLTAGVILGAVISVVLAGLRMFVTLYNEDYDAHQREMNQNARNAVRSRAMERSRKRGR